MINVYPYYDVTTKEIKGCKKYSLAYWHEYRHLRQHKNDLFTYFFILLRYMTYALLIYFGISQEWNIYLTLVFMYIALDGYIEIDAWIYAFKKRYGVTSPNSVKKT